MSRIAVFLLATLGLAALLAAVLGPGEDARAQDILANGGFEVWSSPLEPDDWAVAGNVSLSVNPAHTGNALLATGSVTLTQFVAATAGAGYTAQVQVQSVSGMAEATIEIEFLDGDLSPMGVLAKESALAPAQFTGLDITVPATAPAGSVYVGLRLRLVPVDAGASVVFDSATLDEVVIAEPTPSPTNTPTPEPTSTEPGPSETPEPAITPVPPATPPVAPIPGQPTGPIDTTRPEGELLANRGFSFAFNGAPWSWDNFGGTLAWSGTGGRDDSGAATFISLTDSTKWIFQVVPVTGGAWYSASAFAAISAGEGEAWLSVLWYASVDGSGSNIGEAESTVSGSHTWNELSTGPVESPFGARSARFRLMLKGDVPVAATFDDASLMAVAEPSDAAATPAGGGAQSAQSGQVGGATYPDQDSPASEPSTAPMKVPLPPRTGGAPLRQPACSLCISEVVADPWEAGRDAPFEWVELVNRSGSSIDTSGWQVGDSKTLDSIPATIIASGGRLVVAGRSAVFDGEVLSVVPGDGEVGSGLNNGDDVIRLVAPDGSTADTVAYGPGTEIGAAAAGLSLALDESTGTWLSDMPPSPGASSAIQSVAVTGSPSEVPLASLPVTSGGAKTDTAAWIVLGACAAAGIFAAPFAWRRSWPGIRARLHHAR